MNAYLFAIREHADEKLIEKIDDALKPPASYRVGNRPAWFDEDDAWAEFERQMKR